MLADIDLANLCASQYDGEAVFDHDFTNDNGDRYCIKYYPDCTAIVHEGSHDFLNWFNNARFNMVKVPDFGGVEEGFYLGIPEAVVQALPLIPKDKPVYLTGHSRGAPRAQIMAAMLIKQGFTVITVTFASPRAGDAALVRILSVGQAGRTYRNHRNFEDQDFVCDVPLPYPFGFKQALPERLIDVAPSLNDSWGILARHHLSLYQKGVASYGQYNSSK